MLKVNHLISIGVSAQSGMEYWRGHKILKIKILFFPILHYSTIPPPRFERIPIGATRLTLDRIDDQEVVLTGLRPNLDFRLSTFVQP
jgi:hypothetical protein